MKSNGIRKKHLSVLFSLSAYACPQTRCIPSWQTVFRSNGSLYFTCFETARAHLDALDRSVHVYTNRLDVRKPTAPSLVFRVAHQVAGLRLFAAHIATSCHSPHPL